jgi:hypothetical protein
MARRPSPKRSLQPDPANLLHRISSTISDWRVLIGAVVGVAMCGGVAYAFVGGLATKAEVRGIIAPLVEHATKDDQERAENRRAMQDFKENQDRLLQWVWELKQRK